MASVHVAHDCRLGDHIIIANATLLGGTSAFTTARPSRAESPCTTLPRSAPTVLFRG